MRADLPRERVAAFFGRDLPLRPDALDDLILRALAEDRAHADVTTEALVPPTLVGSARITAKQGGVIAGVDFARSVLRHRDPAAHVTSTRADGDAVRPGDVIVELTGRMDAILRAERVVLNLMRRASGIATATAELVDLVRPSAAAILDTRKTAPGLRSLDKWAVRAGGGLSHRTDLGEMMLVKENHIAAAGGLTRTLELLGPRLSRGDVVEVEVSSLHDAVLAARAGVPLLLLDNLADDETRIVVDSLTEQFGESRPALESSGNLTRVSASSRAATGVDYLSSGAITHSAPELDLSLLVTATP